MKIKIVRDTQTLRYAADELSRYLKTMNPELDADITVGSYDETAINLGLLSDFDLSVEEVKDAMIDDLVDVNIDSLAGYIAGSNERSVLFGVYKYFKSAGCRWTRPGNLGEYIPKKDMSTHRFVFRKLADHPFRGQAIEGAVSYEHLRDTVYWLPKVDMNLFQIEHVVPYNYMSRWYTHVANTKLPHDDIPYEDYCKYIEALELDIKKCGLQLHALGHGALLEPLGIRYMSSTYKYDISDETKQAFALVGGKRDIYGEGDKRSPSWTQICMSQEWIQDRVINWIADYLKKKPHIDFLHFWLGDAYNNHCECEECIKKTPTDWYVIMLNKLDEKLTKQGSNAKIVFIMYTDTLWPPIAEKLNNPSRFIMTTACSSSKGYSAKRCEGGMPKWERNKFTVAGTLDVALTFIDAWKPIFDGQRFMYEYLFYTAHYADPGYMTYARKVIGNSKGLHLTGFDGIMSDQTQRCYFPTGLPVSAFGESLFDTTIDSEEYIDQYMRDSFGDDWRDAKEYLEKISASFDINALSQSTNVTAQDTGVRDQNAKKATIFGNEAIGDVIATVPDIVDKFAPIIEKNLAVTDKCHKESWRILTYHANYCKGLSKIYFALSRNDVDKAKAAFSELVDYLSEVELEIDLYFDLCLFVQRTGQLMAGQ